ncbi:GxxExxY protein [Patescibacteria group bacterium]|nr:GxxExxY protein [Patescibacteria group bacterium]
MERKTNLKRSDLLYPELSYKIVGALFDVYNQLGPGFSEKYYQRAIANELKRLGISFREQIYSPLKFKEDNIGRHFLDFLIENKIVLEIKKGGRFSKRNIDQVLTYLKIIDLKLGIIANFGPKELKFKRIINFDS